MIVDVKYKNILSYGKRVLSAECEVFIWREGNEYAVSLNMREEIPEDQIYNENDQIEFLASVYTRVQEIYKNWKLVNMNGSGRYGKVIGQRQTTFFSEPDSGQLKIDFDEKEEN